MGKFKKKIEEPQPPSDTKKTLNENCLTKKFQEFLAKQNIKGVESRLLAFYGRNYPVRYNKDFDFNEEWEHRTGEQDLFD